MSDIVTFYSYKGGVGRTMALANVAVLLAKWGYRVLAVDGDLEAPGLERYFSQFAISQDGAGDDSRPSGFLGMCFDVNAANVLQYREGFANTTRRQGSIFKIDYKKYLWTVQVEDERYITLLPSGRENNADYSKNLEAFDWAKFFCEGGGDFFEDLREQWTRDFEIVLIDSRTGLSDTGGICTIQLPDIVVAMFSPNHQSVYGVRDIMRFAQEARQKLAFDRMALTVIPLPARFETTADYGDAADWMQRIEEAFSEFYKDWLPRGVTPRQIVEILKVPHVNAFAFGEKLAVVERGADDPRGMGFVYKKLAKLLVNDFDDIARVLDIDIVHEQATNRAKRIKKVNEYKYDVYVSYARSPHSDEFVHRLVFHLRQRLLSEQEMESKIYVDMIEMGRGYSWPTAVQNAVTRSKVLMAILTPQYFQNPWTLAEWETFEKREAVIGKPLIVPVIAYKRPIAPLLGEPWLPEYVNSRRVIDFRKFVLVGSDFEKTPQFYEFLDRVKDLAKEVGSCVSSAPPFKSAWPIISPDQVRDDSGTHKTTIKGGELTLEKIKTFVAEWFEKLDEHAPSDQLMAMLDREGFEMVVPEGRVKGAEEFRAWYAGGGGHPGVINLFFNERHTVSRVDVTQQGEQALVSIVVRWEASRWRPPTPRCERLVFDALLEWEIIYSPITRTPVIRRHVLEELRPVLGSPNL